MIEADDVQKVYYYGPLRYASQKQNNEVPTVYSKEVIVDHYEEKQNSLTIPELFFHSIFHNYYSL